MAKYLDQSGLTYLWGKIAQGLDTKLETVKVNGSALTVTDNSVDVTLKLQIRKSGDTEYLDIIDSSNNIVTSVDASDFVVDGMLSSVTYDSTAHTMTFIWNTDAGGKEITVDLDDVIAPYVEGNGIDITNNVVSVEVDNDTAPSENASRVTLAAGEAGLRAEIDLSSYDSRIQNVSSMTLDLSGAVESIHSELAGDIQELSGSVENIYSELSQDIVNVASGLSGLSGAVITFSGSVVALEDELDDIHQTIASNINELSGELSAHTSDTDIHIQASERTKWNLAASLVASGTSEWDEAVEKLNSSANTWNTTADNLTAHTNNEDIHVTAQQKADWQDATDKVNASADTWNDIHDLVTASADIWAIQANDGKFTIEAGSADTKVAEFTADQSGDSSLKIVGAGDIVVTADASTNTITIGEDINALSDTDIDAAIAAYTPPTAG